MAILMGISLLALLLMCVIGCFWHLKRHSIRKFNFPSILHTGRSRKPLSTSHVIISQEQKAAAVAEEYSFAGREVQKERSYENVRVGPLKTTEEEEEEEEDKLYENSQPSNFEDHVYGNETPLNYPNFQEPGASEENQDEDIYILPDRY